MGESSLSDESMICFCYFSLRGKSLFHYMKTYFPLRSKEQNSHIPVTEGMYSGSRARGRARPIISNYEYASEISSVISSMKHLYPLIGLLVKSILLDIKI